MRLLQWHEARVVERSGYACGVVSARLQRVESVRVEKKIDKADIGNAAIVVCPGLERIVCYHDLLEGITGMPKREGLLFALFGGGEGIRRLDVDLPGTSIDDEVYLILSRLMDAVLAVIENHHADVHRISTPDEFAVDDIFHQMGRFCLPEVDPGISETGVGRVVLDRIIEIASSFDIVSRGFKNQDLTDYFATKRWYTQTYTPEEFDAISSSQLNDYELKNVQTMYEIEQSRNSPYLETAK